MRNTVNFNLKKPDQNDYVNIGDINDNMDVIDEALAKKYEKPALGIPKIDLEENVQESLKKADDSATKTDLQELQKKVNAQQTDYAVLQEEVIEHQAEDATNEKKGHVQLVDEVNGSSASLVPSQNAVRKKVEQTIYKKTKSGKDSNGVFTTIEYRRKNDNTLACRAVLTGGISPQYTTRTLTLYGIDGTTVENTITQPLSYDADGDLVGES